MRRMPGKIAAMCGRYALYGPRSRSRADAVYFSDLERFPPTYNAAPSQWLPITRLRDGVPRMAAARWGLVPFWAKDERSGVKGINARVETIATNAMFRSAYRARHRCLVPASGFFEWQKRNRAKRPFYVTNTDGSLLAYAGLWEEWRRPDGQSLLTYTIVTTAANELVQSLHDRMPVILRPEDYAVWLEAEDATDIISPYPAELLRAYPVTGRVNSPENNDPDLLRIDEDDDLLK